VRTYTSKLLDDLDVRPDWLLLEDVIGDVIGAWVLVENGNLRAAEAALGKLVADLRDRRDAIEEAAAGGT